MINVTKTYLPDINKYNKYTEQIFNSGWLTNNGELVQTLQKRLCEYLGVKNLLLVTNGTIALQIAYKLLGLSGQVITSPFSFVATTSSLVWENLKPVFADIDQATFNIDPENIAAKINKNTSAILPVHVFGNPCDVETIESIAKSYDLKVIYDAAHCFGVKYKGKSVLEYGDVSTISFHATKLFHTIEGGALIIRDDELYEKAKTLINFGLSNGDILNVGINAKMNEFSAAMGLCVLDDMEKIISERERVWKRYQEAFLGKLKLQKMNTDALLNHHYFPVVFSSTGCLLKTVEQLNKQQIFPRRYFYPSLDSVTYVPSEVKCEISNAIAGRILCLPIYVGLSTAEQDNIIKIITDNI